MLVSLSQSHVAEGEESEHSQEDTPSQTQDSQVGDLPGDASQSLSSSRVAEEGEESEHSQEDTSSQTQDSQVGDLLGDASQSLS